MGSGKLRLIWSWIYQGMWSIYRYVDQKRKSKENALFLINKTREWRLSFASVFTGDHSVKSLNLKAGHKVPPIVKDQVQDHLGNPNLHKSMGPDEMHPGVLRQLADVLAKTFSIILGKSCQSGEVPCDCRKGNIVSIFKRIIRGPWELLASQPYFSPW